jgi:tRNA A37 threonylcarbamoyladenosine synthetase subunit TsaC/SUA5/YrdC
MPDHDLAREILDRTGPLAVSSANLTGSPAATDATAAVEMLGDRVAVIVDGGATAGATPSTIVDVTGDRPRLLRSGMITVAQLDEALAESGLTVETADTDTDTDDTATDADDTDGGDS